MSEIHAAQMDSGTDRTRWVRDRIIRVLCLLGGGLWLLLAAGLYTGQDWATSLWPWPDVRMSFVFLASIAAAVAAPLVWTGVTGEFAAFAGLAINVFVLNVGATVYLAWRWVHLQEPLHGAIAASLAGIATAMALYLWSRRIPMRDPRPMPAIVHAGCVVFAALLIVVGSALALQMPRIFPWNLTPQDSTLFGLIFLGAAAYFVHATTRPRWGFGAAPLWSFLAYDIVLFAPYLRMLGGSGNGAALADYYGRAGGTASSVNMPSLSVYLTVLTVSTLLALYMFFVDARTRVVGRGR
jgi:hypothetical protein